MVCWLKALFLGTTLTIVSCSNTTNESAASETVYLTQIPTVAIPTLASTSTITAATQEPVPQPIPELLIWPRFEPEIYPSTPDEAATAFAAQIAETTVQPRPAVVDGQTATAQLPRTAEDGSSFGLASTIYLQQVQLPDSTLVWVVTSALSPDIVVESPAVGELLAGGTVVVGEGNGFEGTIILEIEDQDGLLGLAIADGGALGENLPFVAQLPFSERPASGNWANLIGFTTSAVDGSLSALTMLPMRLLDGS